MVVVSADVTTEGSPLASIVKRQPKGCPQPVYYYHETYRVRVDSPVPGKKASKVKSKDVYLGTASQILEKIRNGQSPQRVSVKEFGLVMAALREAEEIGLVDVIDRLVPKRRQGYTVGQYILVAALNKIAAPMSRNGIRDWLYKTVLPERLGIDPDVFTSQNFWDHFDLILSERDLKENKERFERGEIPEEELFNDEVIGRIEEGIWRNILERQRVPLDSVFYYDTTNFYSFLETMTPSYLARTGYNKHGRHNLRQVGLGLAITRDGSLPVLHLLHHGRQADARLFPGSMTELVQRYLQLTDGAQKLTVVFDKGNNSEENVQKVRALGITAVGSLVPSHHRDLMGVRLARYSEEVDGRPVYVTKKNVFGMDVKIAVVYNAATDRRQRRRLREKVDQLRAAVKERFEAVKDRPKEQIEAEVQAVLRESEYGRYLTVAISGRRFKRLICKIHLANYHAKIRTFGKLVVFTTNTDLSAQEMVRLYTGKYEIENQFKQMNDPEAIAFRPRFHWTDTKIKVYALICVLALLLLQLMNYRVRQAGLGMSNAVLRQELADIREVVIVYSLAQIEKRITEMSTIQQRLFELFDLGRYTHPRTTTTLSLRGTG